MGNRAADIAGQIIWLIERMPDDERVQAFGYVFEHYCEHCGRYHGDDVGMCQCWNDE